jgi:uncharacterized Zn finger protein
LQYLDCPRCRARFHTGVIYERLVRCPRCGSPLEIPQPRVRERLRALIGHHHGSEQPDWETVTSSQYAVRSYVTRIEGER